MKLPIQQIIPLNSDTESCEGVALPNIANMRQSLGKAFRSRASKRDNRATPHTPLKGGQAALTQLSFFIKALKSPFEGGLRGMALLLILLMLPLWSLAEQSIPTSNQLESYLQQAAQNNPGLRAQFSEYLAALQQVPQVNTLPDPEFSFGYFITPIETRVGPQRARLSLSQMFPWFGTLAAKGDAATKTAKARFEVFQEARNKLFFEVKKIWYQLYHMDRSIQILKENISILETFERLALQRYETGQVSQVNVLRVQIEKEELYTRLALLGDSRMVLAQQINELLNQPKGTPVEGVDTLQSQQLPLPLVDLERAVARQNPQLTQLDYEAASARKSVDVARKEGRPKFGVGLDYTIVSNRRQAIVPQNGNDGIFARVGIQIPLYRKKYDALKRQAKIRLRAIQDRQTAIENHLETRLKQVLRDYYDAERRVTLYKEIQTRRTRQAIDILLEEYATSSANFEELLRLQQKLLGFQLSQQSALVDQNTAIAFIEYLYGKYNVTPGEIDLFQN